MKISKRAGAVAVLAASLATVGSLALAADAPTGADGFTPVTQTRVYDSTRINGDVLLGSGQSAQIDPNATTKGLIPSGATAVEIQITAAQETETSGDLDVTPTQISAPATSSNLNYAKGTAITSSTVATLGADGTFWVYNHGGTTGNLRLIVDILGYYAPTAVYTPPASVTWSLPAAGVPGVEGSNGVCQGVTDCITTGGSAKTNSTPVGSFTLDPGTYQVSVNAKATPNAQTTSAVYPQFYVYGGQELNSTNGFTGDLFNIGSGALQDPGADLIAKGDVIDSYFSGSGVITVTGAPETIHLYAFGYDEDTDAGSYTLDALNVVAVPVNPAS